MKTPEPLSTIQMDDGRMVALRHVEESDAQLVLAYVERISAESDFLTFGPGEFGLTLEQETGFIKSFADPAKGVMLKAVVDDELTGLALVNRAARPRIRHVGDLGLSVRRDFWSRGIGLALCRAIFAEARRIGVTRIALRVRADNSRAIRLYERLGFLHEGRLVGAFLVHGVAFDELVMGLQI